MILDCHIHIREQNLDTEKFLSGIKQAEVDGGIIISLPPEHFHGTFEKGSPKQRLEHVISFCEADEGLYPFFWVDPLEKDAPEQVKEAAAQGISGIKIICDRFLPGHEQAMEVYRTTAQAGLPILFHSGILWDGAPSSPFNRPAGFESLLEIEGLRFSLAHISWPWCDECIAVYGKFLNALGRRKDLSVEMFIDTTPGTPPIFRKDALTKLFTTGYDVQHNVIFGSDCYVNGYNADWVNEWVTRDTEIMNSLSLGQDMIDSVFSQNLKRFLGLEPDNNIEKEAPKQAK
ncbi:amidohydrolase family protein [Planctomycetota bacterium]